MTQPTQGPPELIRRRALFSNPDKTSAQISPDGKLLGYLAPVDGVLNVWVGPISDPAAAAPVTHDTDRGIRFYWWAYTNRHLLYAQDQGGDEDFHIYVVDLGTGEVKDLTPFEGVQARVQEVSHRRPGEVLLAVNNRDPQLHDIYRANLETGEMVLALENPGFAGFVTDADFNVRFGLRMTPDGGSELLRREDHGGWEPFISIEMEDTLTTGPWGIDSAGSVLYLADSRGRDTSAAASVDLESGDYQVIAESQRADVSDAMFHPETQRPQAVAFTHLRKEWHTLDDSVAQDLEFLKTVADGEIEVVSRTLDDRQWIAAYLLDDGPVNYYHYLREEKRAEFLFTNRTALNGLPLAKMHPVSITSRDGLELVDYFTLPVQHGSERPDHPLPTVLLVHGGPWHRDNWGFNSLHQLLANRGYAILSVNFRGSTGFGKEFINAANLEWGGKMHDDLMDAVAWAVQEGIADPERIAIMGGSYGGYATLVGMTFTPEVFACGVDIVGPSNLLTLIESIPAYWQPQLDLWASRVGDPRTEEGKELLISRSPLSYVAQIRRPLLIGQGANDPRVKQAESDQIVSAMQEKEIPVTYALYPDEGHGFAKPENNLSFFAVAEAFLARHLGGRHEPVGEDFQGASLQVVTGAEGVPGLAEALESQPGGGA